VAAADLVRALKQRHELHPLPVEGDRHAALERDVDDLRLVGRALGRLTSWKTSSSGACDRSSIQRPSDERPQRLSSIEYGAPLTGMPIGFAILNFNAQRRAVLKRLGSVKSTVIVSVTDADNNPQNVRRDVTVVAGR
jgi:hypothetical protein